MKNTISLIPFVSILLFSSCRVECHDPLAANYSERGKHRQSLCRYYDSLAFYSDVLENGPITIYYSESRHVSFDSIGMLYDNSVPSNCQYSLKFPNLLIVDSEIGHLVLKDSASIDTVDFNFPDEKECRLINIAELL